jgi:hypothetical protein
VKRGVLSTPSAAAGILRGITRDTVIQLAQDLYIECHRTEISREELYTADELFLCGTAAEITPITEVDGRPIGTGNYPITRKLQRAYEEAVRGRSKKHADWLSYLSESNFTLAPRSKIQPGTLVSSVPLGMSAIRPSRPSSTLYADSLTAVGRSASVLCLVLPDLKDRNHLASGDALHCFDF